METLSPPTQILRQAVGLDISKDRIEAAMGGQVVNAAPHLASLGSIDNTKAGFADLISSVESTGKDPKSCLFLMESTGVYYERAANWLYEQGYQVAVLLPNTVLAFAKSWNVKTKSDQVDARTLAQMGCERHLSRWEPAPKQLKTLKQLTRHRERLVHQRTMTKNQYHASLEEAPVSETVIQYQKKHLTFLSQQIKEIEIEIKKLIESDEEINKSYQYILSIPSLGETVAAILLAETQNFRLFRNKAQLVSYAGYDVIKKQSGSSINFRERISKKGNHRIRKALYFPSITAQRYIPAFQRLYHRINQKNANTKMKGAVALQRKLLVLAYHLVKNQQFYDPEKAK